LFENTKESGKITTRYSNPWAFESVAIAVTAAPSEFKEKLVEFYEEMCLRNSYPLSIHGKKY
jgi:hypothetical protein